ncbi:hypothetical protein PYK79_48465 [Streptomyces sp. ID05-04B]|nr:hypothetical protein [Streptomyces sp. ID05-04B]MDX5569538.1 hypothetical protein [Streptomyces sp. ID05-04B]
MKSISVVSRQIGKPPGSVFTVLKHRRNRSRASQGTRWKPDLE